MMKQKIKNINRMLLLVVSMLISTSTMAKVYPLPMGNSRLVGERINYIVPKDSRPLESIAAEFNTGLLAMLSANPGIDPLLPRVGDEIIIPSLFLLPDVPHTGIVINLAELRLYYFPANSSVVHVYPIGIGQLGLETPVTITKVINKHANPTWTPTAAIRERYAKAGTILPPVVPAGPDNPMGLFAIRLAVDHGTYLIHGTNANFGIGLRVSSGCIRLRPPDIEELFNMVPIGTQVNIINEPVKFAIEPNGRYYLEVHQPLSRTIDEDPQTIELPISSSVQQFLSSNRVNQAVAQRVLNQRAGLPTQVN